MNRLILKYAYPLTAVVLVVFAWVVARRLSGGWTQIVPLAVAAAIVWVIGVPTFVLLWPRIRVNGFKRAILRRGFGGGPIPLNTLYAVPATSSETASLGSLVATGTDDVFYVGGWLDLRAGPQVLHVPDTAGRYYGVQLTDSATGASFAYVGKRTTGTGAGDDVLSGPGWRGTLPPGMAQISAPHRSVLVIGRVFVANDADRPTAYALAQQIRVTPLDR